VSVQTLRGAEGQASGLSRTPEDGVVANVVDDPADSPSGRPPPRRRRLGFAQGSRARLPRAAPTVTDDQIRALVVAAEGLGRRQRQHRGDATAAADERLLRLDWAVRTGRLVLAHRAASQASGSRRTPAPGAAALRGEAVVSLPAQARSTRTTGGALRTRLDLMALLEATDQAPPAEGVDALAAQLAARVGAVDVSMLIADISGAGLVRLPLRPAPGRSAPSRPAGQQVRIDGTAAGRALVEQRSQVTCDDGRVWVHVPVSARGEAIGVLELSLDETPGADVLADLASAGQALAHVTVVDRRFSDLYEVGQRSTELALEAEIQRRLLPASYACEGPQFALAGWLIPAERAGGDTFDYVVDRGTLHLSITDAMGHGVPAALLATLAVGSLRNSRRSGLDLVGQARQASSHIAAHAAPDQFVTALLGRIDLQTGALQLVNAGHMLPLLVRDGRVSEIPLEPGLVLGVEADATYDVQCFQLHPGDRLALVTDGMSEREAAGAEIDSVLATLAHLHPRQTVQVLTGAVLAVTSGAVRDDATVLVIDWYGEGGTPHAGGPPAGD
jgi:hypothetical protein